jgi:hypothetical protein
MPHASIHFLPSVCPVNPNNFLNLHHEKKTFNPFCPYILPHPNPNLRRYLDYTYLPQKEVQFAATFLRFTTSHTRGSVYKTRHAASQSKMK